jgi:hypothetical protein
MKWRLALVVGIGAILSAEPALAIPAFARRYKLECNFCHRIYPKLTDAGERFKERGFRLDADEKFDADAWIRSVPLVLRAQGNRTFVEKADDFNYGFLKAISAGNLGQRLSYWVDDGALISEGDDNFTHTEPDNAWARFELIKGGKLYLKGGRIELDLPFSQTRTPHLFSYDIYSANTGFETDNIGSYQDGVELGGYPGDFHWSAAVVKGRNDEGAEAFSNDVDKFDANVFARVSRRLSEHRVGAFAYIGRNTLATSRSTVWEDDILRLGLDASVWLERLNLYGVYMYGRNDNSIATAARPRGTGESLSFNGGFAQADFHVHEKVALTARLNVLRQPSVADLRRDETLTSFFPGIQLWHKHLKLSFEYGFPNRGRRSLGAVQAEAAF